MIDIKAIATEVKPLILQAGDIILDAWNNKRFDIRLKDDRDVVTDTDTEVEEYLRKYLYNVLPQAGFIVEEGKSEMLGEYNWTIDPIDGTKFFAAQTPTFFTQIALLKKSQPILSFVYNPISKQLFYAIKGQGAYCNDILLKKELTKKPLSKCIVHFNFGSISGKENSWKFNVFQRIAANCYRTSSLAGFLTPYLVFSGIDISINPDIKTPLSLKNITDLAPHKLLLTEAGYSEELATVDGHSFLIWASKEHIAELKSLLI